MTDYDLIIIGGGLVGGSLACALKGTGLRVAVVEGVALESARQPSYDERVLALSWGSRRIFDGMGLWPAIAAEAEPIRHIHISDRGRFGFARLNADEEGVEALGYVAAARAIGNAIVGALKDADGVDLICPARLGGFRANADGVEVEVAEQGRSRVISARLLVAADGGDSSVRRRLRTRVSERDYGVDALITTVRPERPRPGFAYERFTDEGPMAMLPMTEGRWSVVWTLDRARTASVLGLSDEAFLERLQERFGQRLGRLGELGRRVSYPLKQLLVKRLTGERVVLIGNAAHTLHPVAGQGFNLGLRDVAELADFLVQGAGRDVGADDLLREYARRRLRDQGAVAKVTDALARLFVNPVAPVRTLRDLGLLGLDVSPSMKHLAARQFMGTAGRLPRLARGLPLSVESGESA